MQNRNKLTDTENKHVVTKADKSGKESQILYDIIHMWILKNNTSEYICKTETNSQIQKTNVWSPKQRGKKGGT